MTDDAAPEVHGRALERVTDGLVALDADLRCTYVNSQAERLLGHDGETLLGERLWELSGVEETVPERRVREAVETRQSRSFQRRAPTLGRWFDVRVYPDERGVTLQFVDVTERRERAAVDAELTAEYETLLERTRDSAFVVDVEYEAGEPTFRYLRLSRAHQDATGLDAEELRGKTPRAALGERQGSVVAENYRRCVETGERIAYEERLDLPTGESVWETELLPVVVDGTVSRIVGIGHEVTDRVEREQVLAELHETGSAIVDAESVTAVAERTVEAADEVLDLDLSVVSVEEEGVLRTVATSEELPEGATRAIPVEENLAGKSYRTGEALLVEDTTDHPVAADGQFRSGISVPIGDHGNFQAVAEEPAAFDREDLELAELLVDRARSALDRVERERELRRENERLDEFASVVSHDLRNPLEVAIGRTELLDPEVDDEHRQEIADALDRMATIVDDTLTLARHGETVGETDPVSLPALVERCWATVDAPAASYVVDDLVVRADDDRLRHVFENLFDNAVTHGGPTVTVRVGELETGFYVADDGPGIPPDEREAVLEPGHTAAEGGTGFGLTIVRRIAGAHGWAVDVTESADGGARFEFTGVEVLERPGAGRAGNDGA